MPAPSTRAYDRPSLSWAAALVVGALAAAASPVPDLVHHRLDSGLTLLVVPSRAAPVVAVQAWVGAGSADEAPGHAGVAHLVEHMLFKGTLRRGVGEIAGTVEAAGGDVNAWTSFDQTVYHAVLGSRDLDVGLDVLADALVSSTFDEDELERERRVVAEEIRQGLDDPGRAAAHALFATAYVIHPYRRPVIGNLGTVASLRRDDVVAFHRAAYVADNVTLVIAGDVDPEDARRGVERHFAGLRPGPVRRGRAIEPAQVAPRGVVVTHDVSEAQLALGFHAPPLRALDTAALDLAAVVLGQGESSRLTARLRNDRELVTGVVAQLHALRDPGLFVISATARPDRLDAAAEAITAELTRLGDELTAAELDKARTAVEAAQLYQLETAEGLARKYGWHHANAGDVAFERAYLERVRGATVGEVRDAVRRTLRADNATIAAVVPPSRALATGAGRAAAARRLVGKVARARRVAERARTRGRGKAATTRQTHGDVVREVLPGGTRVLVLRDPSVPIVAMRAVWPGGTRLETEATSGLTALLAATVTRGCGERDAAAVADEVDRLAGGLVGVGGRNSFGVRAEWLAKTWQAGLGLFADCILAPRFDVDEVDRQRRALLDDLAARADSGAHQAFRLFVETLYAHHPYRLDPLGTPASIDKLSARALRKAWTERYPASAMTIAVVGDVEPDEVIDALRARLADVDARAAKAPAVAAETFTGRPAAEREVYRDLPREQAHLVIGFPGTTVAAPDRFAVEVLAAILGGQGGRLFVELRDRRALAYRVSAFAVDGVDPGYLAIHVSCSPDKVSEAASAIRTELDRLVADGVDDAEVARAVKHLTGAHAVALQRRSAIANALAYHEAYGLGWTEWDRYPDRLAAVTAEDVARAAATYLDWDVAVTATVRPPDATAGAEKRAKGVRKKAPKPKAKPRTKRPSRQRDRRSS